MLKGGNFSLKTLRTVAKLTQGSLEMAEVLVESGQEEGESVKSEFTNLLLKLIKIVGTEAFKDCLSTTMTLTTYVQQQ